MGVNEIDLFNLFAKISLNTEDYENGLEEASGKTSKFADKIKGGLATAAKVGAAALGAAAAGVVALTKQSIANYAEYEQLVGGVETLFKGSANAVIGYANNAYKTAGLSANQYMNTVTSFSASLLQSLGQDTEAAARYADMAITDMSDNANKMGTSMEMIQDAYQGFAKQNYTMLDNLKLGYGGTKEEMQRLLADAERLSGLKFDISSYADIVDAIHIVQTEMGITGTTALEASTTIQGSLASVKAAWTNLSTGFADETQDLDGLITNFTDSVGTAFGNLVPRITAAISGFGMAIPKLASVLTNELPGMIESTLPVLVSAVTDLVVAFVEAWPSFITMITDMLPMLIETIVNALPELLPALIGGIVALIAGIANALPTIIIAIVDALPTIIQSICTALMENIPILIQGAIQLVLGIVQALPEIIVSLIEALPDIIMMVVDVIINNVGLFIEAAVQIVFALVAALPEIVLSLIEAVVNAVIDLAEKIKEKWPEFKEAAKEWFRRLLEGIKEKWKDVETWATATWKSVGNWFSGLWDSLVSIGKNVIDAIWEGLKSAWESVVNWFNGVWDSLFGQADKNAQKLAGKSSGGAGSSAGAGVKLNATAMVAGSHASGLNYVPFDGYIAELHRGEMVVPAKQADDLRRGKTRPAVSVVQYISSEAKTAADLMQEAVWYQERAVLTGV